MTASPSMLVRQLVLSLCGPVQATVLFRFYRCSTLSYTEDTAPLALTVFPSLPLMFPEAQLWSDSRSKESKEGPRQWQGTGLFREEDSGTSVLGRRNGKKMGRGL